MSSVTLTDEQLLSAKGQFVNAILNSSRLADVVQMAGAHLNSAFAGMNADDFRDYVMSSNSLQVWNELETAVLSNAEADAETAEAVEAMAAG